MKKYYVIKREVKTQKLELLEVVKFSNLREARVNTYNKYKSTINPLEEQLICVGEAGYKEHYKKQVER